MVNISVVVSRVVTSCTLVGGYQDFRWVYEVVSKIVQTGAAIYIAVVIARSTGRWHNYRV
jgi:hypothetical protein